MSFLLLLIVAIVAGSLCGIYGFIAYPDATKAILGDEKIRELTYQFFLITVLGGLIAWLYKELDRLRGQRSVLREMHAELLQAYNRAKTVRRNLRAKVGTMTVANLNAEVTAKDYEEEMEELSDSQLAFEVYAKRANEPWLWFRGGRKLAGSLQKIEGYLNEIVKEYQREFAKFTGNPPTRKLCHLRKLAEFIGPYEQTKEFQECFKYPMRDALQALGKIRLK